MTSTTELIARGVDPSELTAVDRNDAISLIRAALKRRSCKTWSVTGGRGTAWGWITITATPKRLDTYGGMSDGDATDLAALLGLDYVHHQGVCIAAASDYRREYIARALGLNPLSHGIPYWD